MSNSISEISTTPATGATAAGGPVPTLPPELPLTPARRAWVENIAIILNHKALILTVTAVVTVAAGIYAFTAIPNYYKASAVILPARHAGGLDNITSGIASGLKDIGLAKLGGGTDDAYTPLSLMQSRELMATIVKKFNFISVYEAKNLSDAIDQFRPNLDSKLNKAASLSFFKTQVRSGSASCECSRYRN